MPRIIDEALRRVAKANGEVTNLPERSILIVEFLVPKKWTNRIVETAGKEGNPFVKMEDYLKEFLEDEAVLIGFTIRDRGK